MEEIYPVPQATILRRGYSLPFPDPEQVLAVLATPPLSQLGPLNQQFPPFPPNHPLVRKLQLPLYQIGLPLAVVHGRPSRGEGAELGVIIEQDSFIAICALFFVEYFVCTCIVIHSHHLLAGYMYLQLLP